MDRLSGLADAPHIAHVTCLSSIRITRLRAGASAHLQYIVIMSKTLLSFPGDVSGVALLFLRFSVATLPIAIGAYFGPLPSGWMSAGCLVAACIALGFLTRPAALVCAGATTYFAVVHSDILGTMLLLHVLDMLALLALGAGAYSIDSWLYGRRVVRF